MERQIMGHIIRICARNRRLGNNGHSGKNRGYGRIMELLSQGEGYTQQQIADRLDIRPQSVSEAITALYNRGFVQKRSVETDRRCKQICITEEGRLYHAQLLQQRGERAKQLMSALSEEEKKTLLGLLKKINEGDACDGSGCGSQNAL